MPANDRQLAPQGAIDQPGEDLVQPREQPLGHAEQPLARRPAQQRHQGIGHDARVVHRHAEFGVQRAERCAVHRGAHGARREVRHLHRAVGELAPQGFAEAAQGELAGAVGRVAGIAEIAEDRADIDDAGRGLRTQQRQQAARELHRRECVDVDDALERRVALLVEPGELARARVVDEQIDAARDLGRGMQHSIAARLGCQIGGDRPAAPAVADDPALQGVELRPIASDEQQHAAQRREPHRDGPPDAAGRAREHGAVGRGAHAAAVNCAGVAPCGSARNTSP